MRNPVQDPIFHDYTFTEADRTILDRDGHLALPSLLTQDACHRLTASLARIQELHEAHDEPETSPQRYVAEYDEYMASLIGHRQMLTLAHTFLGPVIRYDHCVGLNRRGGDKGSNWHSHAYADERPELGFIRVFFYVNGFEKDDANLKVVPGSHLYRDRSIHAESDKELCSGWLKGKAHPLTGEPLELVPLEVPPGTVIIMWTHAAHGVTARRPDSVTRWCVVYAYRNPGEPSGARWITERFENAGIHGTDGLMSLL